MNKEVYEVVRNLVMYAKENNHYVKVFLASENEGVLIHYYHNKRYSEGYRWMYNSNFMVMINVMPYKLRDDLDQDTYYIWQMLNFVTDKTEDWASVNYREPKITKAFEIALKTIYGEDLGQSVLEFALTEYDNERIDWFVNGKNYYNFFAGYREDLGGLEVCNDNGSAESAAVFFGTNKIFK